jgi:hypothetical protein
MGVKVLWILEKALVFILLGSLGVPFDNGLWEL